MKKESESGNGHSRKGGKAQVQSGAGDDPLHLVEFEVPAEVLPIIDRAVASLGVTREEFVRLAIRTKLDGIEKGAIPEVKTSFALPRGLHDAAMKHCEAAGVSFSELMVKAIRREMAGVGPAAGQGEVMQRARELEEVQTKAGGLLLSVVHHYWQTVVDGHPPGGDPRRMAEGFNFLAGDVTQALDLAFAGLWKELCGKGGGR